MKPTHKFVWGSALAAVALLVSVPALAQAPVTVLVLDQNAIRANVAPNNFPPLEINATIADVGVRDSLPFFNVREGHAIMLPGGSSGHEGFLAFTSVPSTWDSTVGEGDGLDNFVYAGPGLGSPDASGSRISRLGTQAQVVPLGPAGLQLLVGRTVCAVAYSGELPRSGLGVNLSGANLGILAFSVNSLAGGDSGTLPSIEATVLETRHTCTGALQPMTDAPGAGQ